MVRFGPLGAVLITLFPATLAAQSATFASLAGKTGLTARRLELDWPHSSIEFTARFMGLSRVRGAFGAFSGTVMYDSADVTRSTVAVVIDVKSLNTNVKFRDDHLRSPDFFDAAKYPTITFRSTRVERAGDGLLLRGPLTLHGVTREIAIPFTQLHPLSKDAWGNQRIGFLGHTSLSRKDYGILGTAFWNSEFDPGRMSIGEEIEIELMVSAKVSNVERWQTPKGDSVLAAADRDGWAGTLARFRQTAADSTTDAGKFTAPILSAVTVKLMHRQRFAEALEVYRLWADLRPADAEAHAGLGEALLMVGKREEAAREFRRAVEADPSNTVAGEYLRHLAP